MLEYEGDLGDDTVCSYSVSFVSRSPDQQDKNKLSEMGVDWANCIDPHEFSSTAVNI